MRVLCLLLVAVSVGAHPNEDLLTRTLDSMDGALRFMANKYWELNVDGVLGIRIIADQVQVLLTRVDGQLRSCPALHPLLIKLDSLLRLATSTVAIATQAVSVSQPKYYGHIGPLLAKGVWALDFPDRYLNPAPVIRKPNAPSFDEHISDNCLAELSGSGGQRSCNISDYCWQYMTSPGLTKYYITHQVLYLEISETIGCIPQMTQRSLASFGKNVDAVRNDLCYEIYTEAKEFEKANYPVRWQDLLMEQVALCGILGYRDFLQIPWLEKILSLQDASGCYSDVRLKDILAIMKNGRRKKREDVLMDGGCSAHKTAVAMGALVISARFMVDELLATQPCI